MGSPVAAALIPEGRARGEEGWKGISGLEAWAPQSPPSCRRLPTGQADHGAILPGASQLSLVWPACAKQPIGLSPLFARGVQRMSPGPGPSRSLGNTNLQPWLFVLMFYPIGECRTSKTIRFRPLALHRWGN